MYKKTLLILSGTTLLVLVNGCGVREAIQRNDDRYARPGAMDFPLTGIYNTYQVRLLDRYRVTHQWVNSSGCAYRGVEQTKLDSTVPGRFYIGRDIYEDNGKTWLRFEGMTPYDFDIYVRSVKKMYPVFAPPTKEELEADRKDTMERIEYSRRTGRMAPPSESTRTPLRYEEHEDGLQPLCFEAWWGSSHRIGLALRKQTLKEMQDSYAARYPEGQWTTKIVNGMSWRAYEVAEDRLRPRPLNGTGGPYQYWLLPIGNTGYTMSLELGASKESLQYPQAHAAVQAVFRHLIESVKIESLR